MGKQQKVNGPGDGKKKNSDPMPGTISSVNLKQAGSAFIKQFKKFQNAMNTPIVTSQKKKNKE
jgi:hypothetical protein